jgi:hypothetical protein
MVSVVTAQLFDTNQGFGIHVFYDLIIVRRQYALDTRLVKRP